VLLQVDDLQASAKKLKDRCSGEPAAAEAAAAAAAATAATSQQRLHMCSMLTAALRYRTAVTAKTGAQPGLHMHLPTPEVCQRVSISTASNAPLTLCFYFGSVWLSQPWTSAPVAVYAAMQCTVLLDKRYAVQLRAGTPVV
jgi:hypothetical protein